MIIPVNVDPHLDEVLIDWLKTKRNRSDFIRKVLEDKMREETRGKNPNPPPIEKPKEINRNILSSLNKLCNIN